LIFIGKVRIHFCEHWLERTSSECRANVDILHFAQANSCARVERSSLPELARAGCRASVERSSLTWILLELNVEQYLSEAFCLNSLELNVERMSSEALCLNSLELSEPPLERTYDTCTVQSEFKPPHNKSPPWLELCQNTKNL